MVVLQHFSATAEHQAAVSIPSLVPHGYMAVSLFFVLSGFIMAYTYEADFAQRGAGAMPSFLLKRIARILPLNTVMVIVIVGAGSLSNGLLERNIFYTSTNPGYDIICNLLLLQGFGVGLNLNGPSWSICTEFAAYLLCPALLALALSRRSIVSAAVFVIAVAALVMTAWRQPRLGLGATGIREEVTLCFAQFYLGLLTFRITRIPAMRDRLQSDLPALLAAGWAVVFLVLRLDLLTAVAFPAVVATLACNNRKVAGWLTTPLPYFLGEISFSIYLIHDPLRPLALELLRTVHPALLGMVPALAFALLASFFVIPFAWVAYLTVERPGRRVVRGMSERLWRPAHSAAPELASTAATAITAPPSGEETGFDACVCSMRVFGCPALGCCPGTDPAATRNARIRPRSGPSAAADAGPAAGGPTVRLFAGGPDGADRRTIRRGRIGA
jgi:peptidoglycan/LPS O-acetylase OafA/YrhL